MRRCAPWAVVAMAMAALARDARADDTQECISATDRGQQLRDDGRYAGAREAFAQCSRDVCPAPVRRDCVKWLAELEQNAPSVVVSAKDERGADLVDVRVLVDGAVLVSRLDGKPVAIDPGEHALRYEIAGRAPVEERVVIRVGEKNRLLSARFAAAAANVDRGTATATATVTGTATATGTPVVAWVFTGVAAIGFGSEAYFGLTGMSQRSDLKSQPCAQTATCAQSDVDAIRTRFLVADVSLGVGVVSAALAAYFFLSSHGGAEGARAAATVDVVPLHGGGAFAVGTRF